MGAGGFGKCTGIYYHHLPPEGYLEGLEGCIIKPSVKRSSVYTSDKSFGGYGGFGGFFAFHAYRQITHIKSRNTHLSCSVNRVLTLQPSKPSGFENGGKFCRITLP